MPNVLWVVDYLRIFGSLVLRKLRSWAGKVSRSLETERLHLKHAGRCRSWRVGDEEAVNNGWLDLGNLLYSANLYSETRGTLMEKW